MSDRPTIPPSSVAEIVDFFQRQQKTVLTLVGFSGSGYEHPDRVRESIDRILDQHDPATTIVNIGVTEDGIGAAYGWAKAKGFTTSGIVSTAVTKFDCKLSADCDFAFVVEDEAYGGYIDGQLSPVSEAMVSVSDLMVGAGGGDVARDELTEMEKRGKPVQFIEAEMNHARALSKAWSKGLPSPSAASLKGSAHSRFQKAESGRLLSPEP